MANNKPTARKKTMDVSKPGKSVPDISSRPVIVTHRPMVEDPMVKPEANADTEVAKTPDEAEKAVVRGPKVILPMSEQPKTEDSESVPAETPVITPEESPKEPDVTDQPAEETNTEETEKSDESDDTTESTESSEASEEAETSEANESNEEAVVGAIAGQVELNGKKKNDQLSEEEKAKIEARNKLIEDKTYFLPIGAVTKKRKNQRAVLFLFFMIVVIFSAYLAADAELIKAPFVLPIDLIKI